MVKRQRRQSPDYRFQLSPNSVSEKIAKLANQKKKPKLIAHLTGWSIGNVCNTIKYRRMVAKRIGIKGAALAKDIEIAELRTPARLTPEHTLSRRAYEMRKAGFEYSEIAEALNHSIRRVPLLVREAGLPLVRVGPDSIGQGVHIVKNSKSEKIVLMRIEGKGFQEIADELGMLVQSVRSHFNIRRLSRIAFCATYPDLDLAPVMHGKNIPKIRNFINNEVPLPEIAERMGFQLAALEFVVEKAPNIYRKRSGLTLKDKVKWDFIYSFENWSSYLPATRAGLSEKAQETIQTIASEYGQHIADQLVRAIGETRYRERFPGFVDIVSVKAAKGDLNVKVRCAAWKVRYLVTVAIPYSDPDWEAFVNGYDKKLVG